MYPIPKFVDTSPTWDTWVQPMNLPVRIVTNHEAISAAAMESFGGFGQAEPVAAPHLTLHLFRHDVDDGTLGEPVFRPAGMLLYQSTGRDSTLVLDLSRRQGYGYFSDTTLSNRAFFRWHFLELAVFVSLEASGWMGVHGAAVVKDGRGILLRAASGGGKTTLAYAAARRHFQALAEDVVWLAPGGTRWWGTPWSFHLLPDARLLFPELRDYLPVLQTNREHKLEVNLEKMRAGSTITSAEPGVIVFVERVAGERSRTRRLSEDEARQRWPAGRTGLEQKMPHHPDLLTRLFRRCTAYHLAFGDDIEAAVALLEVLVVVPS